jgi:hypothetical protein
MAIFGPAMQRRPQGRRVRKINVSILQPRHKLSNRRLKVRIMACLQACRTSFAGYPSFAVIEILAFRTFDTGHPFSAASAYF